MARFLVTGGCGFIGSHLCRHLVDRGDDVVVIDNLDTGKKENLPEKVTFFESCITQEGIVQSLFQDIDGCFHLAAIASVVRTQREWLASHRINQSGFINILLAARQRNVPIVYASSAAVYGGNKALPLKETFSCQPLSPYAVDKLGCEGHAKVASLSDGTPTMGLRFFNVFGPGQDPRSPYSGVISIFLSRLLEGLPIEIFGDGKQTRDFIFVEDVVNYLVSAMAHAAPGHSDILNVCSGWEISLHDLIASLSRLLEVKPEVVYRPARIGDVKRSVGDPNHAQTVLGMRPQFTFEAGLARLIAMYQTA